MGYILYCLTFKFFQPTPFLVAKIDRQIHFYDKAFKRESRQRDRLVSKIYKIKIAKTKQIKFQMNEKANNLHIK